MNSRGETVLLDFGEQSFVKAVAVKHSPYQRGNSGGETVIFILGGGGGLFTTLLEFLSLTYLNPHPHFFQLKTQPAAVTPRTSLYAQALHVGKDKGEAPTLQEANTGSLGALSDRLLLQRRPTVPVGVQISAPLWVLTG